MEVASGKARILYFRTYVPRNAVLDIFATNKDNVETTFTTARRSGDGVEYTVPGTFNTSDNLPATIQYRINGEVKRTETLTLQSGGTGGESGVSSVNTRTGDVVLTKSDVNLGNVDNTSDANKPVSTAQQTALDAKAASSHNHPAADISDSTTTGRNVLTAASQSAARSAIGAGTSNLAVGTGAGDAKAGNYTPPVADLPAGSIIAVHWTGSAWPARPTARTDITVHWIGGTEANAPSGLSGTDVWIRATV